MGPGERHDLHENQLRDAPGSVRQKHEQNVYSLDKNRELTLQRVFTWVIIYNT